MAQRYLLISGCVIGLVVLLTLILVAHAKQSSDDVRLVASQATAASVARATAASQATASDATAQIVAANATATENVLEQEAQGTVTAQKLAAMPYHAAIPGACDKGGAKWTTSTAAGTNTCLSDSLQLKVTTLTTDPVPFAAFHGYTDTVPAQYSVSVEAFGFQDAGQPSCADLELEVYQMSICHNGDWDILNANPAQHPQDPEVAYGTIASQSTYMITATLAGTQSNFKINGKTVAVFTDTYAQPSIGGNGIWLMINPPAFGCAAKFKNFVYTPLSPLP